jgi:hypothetical protein
MSSPARHRMAPLLRFAAYGLVAGLWLSGCAWLLLQGFFRVATPFGPQLHPWQPPLLLVHGVLAIPALYLFGWISPGHALEGGRSRRRRASGGSFWLLLALLVLSGFALYFVTAEAPRALSSWVHEMLGVAAGAVALLHWIYRPAPP